MKQEYFRTLLFVIISFYALTLNLYPQDSLLIDTNNYRLFFIGESQSISELKSKFISGYTFVNIPIDPAFYKQEYPNPFSPLTIKSNFVYELPYYSNVDISIIDNKDSILFNITRGEQPKGFYRFMVKEEYFMQPSINRRILSSFDNIRIIFLIEESQFSFPLRNTNIDKSN